MEEAIIGAKAGRVSGHASRLLPLIGAGLHRLRGLVHGGREPGPWGAPALERALSRACDGGVHDAPLKFTQRTGRCRRRRSARERGPERAEGFQEPPTRGEHLRQAKVRACGMGLLSACVAKVPLGRVEIALPMQREAIPQVASTKPGWSTGSRAGSVRRRCRNAATGRQLTYPSRIPQRRQPERPAGSR